MDDDTMVKFTKVMSVVSSDNANLKDTKWKAIPFKKKLGETDNTMMKIISVTNAI
jgi:hypothetical protein